VAEGGGLLNPQTRASDHPAQPGVPRRKQGKIRGFRLSIPKRMPLFGLDDISVQALSAPASAPAFKAVTQADGMISLTWTTVPGLAYQVQYSGELSPTGWNNLGSPLTATGSTLSVSYSPTASPQRFYRILVP